MKELEIEEHHLWCRFMDNPKGLGKKYNISKKDHNILHLIIPSIIWKYVPKEQRQRCIDEVISFSEYYILNLKKKNNEDLNNILEETKAKEIVKYVLQQGFLINKESLDYLKEIDGLINYKKLIWIFKNYFIKEQIITKEKLKEILEEYEELNKEREDDNK